MKNLKINILLIIALAIYISSCSKIEPAMKYLDINDREYEIDAAYIEDFGTDLEIQYRTYNLSFESSSYSPAPTYLSFDIYSYGTGRLEEGTYQYSTSIEKGKISRVELGKDIEYDETGVETSGIRVLDSVLLKIVRDEEREGIEVEGFVKVGWKNNKYDFDIDLIIKRDDETYVVVGEFNKYLKEVVDEEETIIE